MDELTREFVAESQEGLERMELCLTELEHRPGDGELVSEIFRTVHTIKGTTSFLRLTRLQTLAHAGETLLAALRDGKIPVTPQLIDGLLLLMDGLRTIVTLIETTEKEQEHPDDNDAPLIELLVGLKNAQNLTSPESDTPLPLEDLSQFNLALNIPAPAPSQSKTLRIDVETLNHMMNLVAELVLTRNQILQSTPGTTGFPDLARRLDTVTSDLRESVRQARMQPLVHLFAKFPRMVRDLANTCGRQVRIEFEGQETGLDKTLLEAIRDPLTHAVRNSVDHGIESPEQRAAAGKPAEGVIRLRAFQQSGSVVIEVIDDGGGIPPTAVLKKAMDRGLVTAEHAARMTEHEMLQLIFAPGLSLSPSITHISGRGVGMDVVRTNVQKVGGSVEVESVLGAGTTLRLRVPLTLAIVPALVVQSGGQSFALPQHSLIELINLRSSAMNAVVERIGTSEVFRMRDSLLPTIHLDKLLQLDKYESKEVRGSYIAVMEEGGRRFGLIVDHLNPPEEIVVKPLAGVLRNLGIYSGATVLGNGDLALILDVKTIADRAGHRPLPEALPTPVDPAARICPAPVSSKLEAIMVVYEVLQGNTGAHARMAIPLPQVERIERIPRAAIEFTDGRALLQHQGELILLEDQGNLLSDLRTPGIVSTPSESQTATLIAPRKTPSAQVESYSPMVTIMICQGAPPSGSRRFGIVVHRVLNISAATLLADDSQRGDTQLAMIEERIATVRNLHQVAISPGRTLQEVA